MCVELKIKAKNLADEAKLIRAEEVKRRKFLETTTYTVLERQQTRVETLKKMLEEAQDPAMIKALSKAVVRATTRKFKLQEMLKRNPVKEETRELVAGETGRLYAHRVIDVGGEARATNIARGFIRGLEYSQIEFNPRFKYNPIDKNAAPKWNSVYRMIRKYAPQRHNEFPAWMQRAGLNFSIMGTESHRVENPKIVISEIK